MTNKKDTIKNIEVGKFYLNLMGAELATLVLLFQKMILIIVI